MLVDNCVIRNYTPSALCYPPRWGKNPGLSTIIHLAVWIPFSVAGLDFFEREVVVEDGGTGSRLRTEETGSMWTAVETLGAATVADGTT